MIVRFRSNVPHASHTPIVVFVVPVVADFVEDDRMAQNGASQILSFQVSRDLAGFLPGNTVSARAGRAGQGGVAADQ